MASNSLPVPNEILGLILSQLTRRSDKRRARLTCKTFAAALLSLLRPDTFTMTKYGVAPQQLGYTAFELPSNLGALVKKFACNLMTLDSQFLGNPSAWKEYPIHKHFYEIRYEIANHKLLPGGKPDGVTYSMWRYEVYCRYLSSRLSSSDEQVQKLASQFQSMPNLRELYFNCTIPRDFRLMPIGHDDSGDMADLENLWTNTDAPWSMFVLLIRAAYIARCTITDLHFLQPHEQSSEGTRNSRLLRTGLTWGLPDALVEQATGADLEALQYLFRGLQRLSFRVSLIPWGVQWEQSILPLIQQEADQTPKKLASLLQVTDSLEYLHLAHQIPHYPEGEIRAVMDLGMVLPLTTHAHWPLKVFQLSEVTLDRPDDLIRVLKHHTGTLNEVGMYAVSAIGFVWPHFLRLLKYNDIQVSTHFGLIVEHLGIRNQLLNPRPVHIRVRVDGVKEYLTQDGPEPVVQTRPQWRVTAQRWKQSRNDDRIDWSYCAQEMEYLSLPSDSVLKKFLQPPRKLAYEINAEDDEEESDDEIDNRKVAGTSGGLKALVRKVFAAKNLPLRPGF